MPFSIFATLDKRGHFAIARIVMIELSSGNILILLGFGGGPSETRTPDPLIKSQLLYQLS